MNHFTSAHIFGSNTFENASKCVTAYFVWLFSAWCLYVSLLSDIRVDTARLGGCAVSSSDLWGGTTQMETISTISRSKWLLWKTVNTGRLGLSVLEAQGQGCLFSLWWQENEIMTQTSLVAKQTHWERHLTSRIFKVLILVKSGRQLDVPVYRCRIYTTIVDIK